MIFVFNNESYEKPIYSIVASTLDQVPGALEQIEKLRHSGHLAGYIRKEAFALDYVPQESDVQLTNILKFNLFRHKKPVAVAAPCHQFFCPSLVSPPYARPIRLSTHCDSNAAYTALAPQYPFQALLRDSFEDLVFCGRRTLSQKFDLAKVPLRSILQQALDGTDMVVADFGQHESQLCPADLVLHKKSSEKTHELLVNPELAEDAIRMLCRPAFPLKIRTRLEDGKALFLSEHLQRLSSLARAHAIKPDNVDTAQHAVASVTAPLPGSKALWGEEVLCPWGFLPEPLLANLAAGPEVDKTGAAQLEISVEPDGMLHLVAAPLEEKGTLRAGVAKTCLDERSDGYELDLTRPLLGDVQVCRDNNDETLDESLVVNRFAVASCLNTGLLLFRQNDTVFCAPEEEQVYDSVSLEYLKSKGLVREKLCSLAQILPCNGLYRLTSLHGIERLLPSFCRHKLNQ